MFRQLQKELLNLHDEASKLPKEDPRRAQLASRATELEVKAQEIKAKEQREIEAAQRANNAADEGTMRRLREALQDTQRDAAQRKERSRGKVMF